MGRYFSDKTEKAVRLVWQQYDKNEIQRGIQLLKEAAGEGDADALCFLARTYMGSQYVWSHADIEEDSSKAVKLLLESIRKGSACGVLVAKRCGLLNDEVINTMPFGSVKEARDIVLKKAEDGHPFCQYLIGNTYFWNDVVFIDNIDVYSLYKSQEELDAAMALKAIPWLQKSVDAGILLGMGNLHVIYSGKNGLPKNDAMWFDTVKRGADRGIPDAQGWYADLFYNDNRDAEALHWYEISASRGIPDSWSQAGWMYENGLGTSPDMEKAAWCYENGAKGGSRAAQYHLGRIYFFGISVEQSYEKAFHWLTEACRNESALACPLLGQCYLKGLATGTDYPKARELFEKSPKNSPFYGMALNGLGEIYADGLGVPEDIAKGAEYFQAALAEKDSNAAANLRRFKKTPFGRWKRK